MPPRDGYNPLRWDCEKDGCFNKKRRPKIEVFADCFPGKINFGDVDGLVEVNHYFALLEWKGEGGSLRKAQEIAFSRFTERKGYAVFVVEGDAETMLVERYCIFWRSKQSKWIVADLEMVKDRLRLWTSHAKKAFVIT